MFLTALYSRYARSSDIPSLAASAAPLTTAGSAGAPALPANPTPPLSTIHSRGIVLDPEPPSRSEITFGSIQVKSQPNQPADWEIPTSVNGVKIIVKETLTYSGYHELMNAWEKSIGLNPPPREQMADNYSDRAAVSFFRNHKMVLICTKRGSRDHPQDGRKPCLVKALKVAKQVISEAQSPVTLTIEILNPDSVDKDMPYLTDFRSQSQEIYAEVFGATQK